MAAAAATAITSDSQLFESRLASGFQSLLNNSKNSSYFTLPWIQQALELVNQTHNEMHALVPDLVKNFLCRDPDARWLRSCISDMEKMLEVCTIVIRSIADFRYYQMYVQLAIQSVQTSQPARALQLLDTCIDAVPLTRFDFPENETSRLSLQRVRLEKCKGILLGLLETETMIVPRSEAEMYVPILYGMRTAAIFVLLVLVACLTVRPRQPAATAAVEIRSALRNSRKLSREGLDEELEQDRPAWFGPMMDLYQSLREEVSEKKSSCSDQKPFAFLQELDEVDESVRRLGRLMREETPNSAAVEECVRALRRSVEPIEVGLPAIEGQVNGINKMITSSRAIAVRLLLTSSSG